VNNTTIAGLSVLPYITRILKPTRRDYAVRRERLTNAIRDNLNKKLQVLSAPAGYGKTALLVDVASELNVPVCWYSFAPEDNDPLSLLRYCLQSIRTVYPNLGATYRPLVKGGSNVDWRTYCGFLISALDSDVDEEIYLVFDDSHWIDGKRELGEAVSLLIERAPPKVHFILASRFWPSLSCLPKLAASGDVASLGVSDFRFSTEESVELLTNLWGRSVSSETAVTINHRTSGWAAGILLTARIPEVLVSPNDEGLEDQNILFDYLSAEVFNNLERSLQIFLLRTSILREFTASLCDDLLGVSNSRSNIDLVRDRGLFLEERTGQRATFTYHDLFRDYLERRFRLESPRDYERMSRRAAALYRELGDDDAAIYHYLQVGEANDVVEIIKQVGDSYFNQEHWAKIASWLDVLPAHILEMDSELLLLHARILTMKSGDPTRALNMLDNLLTGDHADKPEVVGNALVAKSMAYRFLGHLDLAVKSADDGLVVLQGTNCSQDYIAEAHRQLASALASQGRVELGKHHFQASFDVARKENLSLYCLICDGMATACMELGELDQASFYLDQASIGWVKLGSETSLGTSLINRALVYYHQGEFDLAFEEASEALTIAEAVGVPRLLAVSLARMATIQQALGAHEDSIISASRCLEIARDLLDQRLIAESTQDLGNAYRKLGQTSKAAVLLNQALLEAEQSGQKYTATHYHLSLGKVFCQDKSYDLALSHLALAEEQLEEINSERRIAEANLFQAAIYYRSGRLKEALEYLARVAHRTSELGYDGFLLADGNELLDVLRYGAARRVGGEAISRLMTRLTRSEPSEDSLSDTENIGPFPELRAVGLGTPKVLLDSHTVGNVEWRSRKAKELFFFLLCNKRILSHEELVEVLWPEVSVFLSDSALKTCIYRLRQAVFYECISAQDAGYRINAEVAIQFDVDEFEEHLRLATLAGQGSAQRESHLVMALELYDGPFLSGYYSEWCSNLRTALELKFHTILINLAEFHSARGDFLQSTELLRRVVESDPYNEEAYYRLVGAYFAANEPLIALQHLRTYARVCREELGVQLPERFTQYRNIIISRLPHPTDTH